MTVSRKRRVLFIEQNHARLQFRTALLNHAGYDVTPAIGQQVLTELERQDYDLVVICETLDDKEAQALFSFIKWMNDATPVVRLYLDLPGGATSWFASSGEPAELLEAVAGVVGAAERASA